MSHAPTELEGDRRVVERNLEYRSGTGKVLTTGDVCKVDGLRGRFEFREHIVRADGSEYCHLVGRTADSVRWGKVFWRPPEDVSRRGGDRSPVLTRRWLHRVRDRDEYADSGIARNAGLPRGWERLTCQECGEDWSRQVTRGRKPTRCPDCS